MDYAEHFDEEAFLANHGMECCECGCCSFICPAKRPLTQEIKSCIHTPPAIDAGTRLHSRYIVLRQPQKRRRSLDVGCVVNNVDTIVAVYRAVIEGRPLMERIVTVTGDASADPPPASPGLPASAGSPRSDKAHTPHIHPYDGKDLSKEKPIQDLLPGNELVYPLSQHIGAGLRV